MKSGRYFEMQVEITGQCAFSCLHCSNISRRSSISNLALMASLGNLVESLPFDVLVYLTGGEPLFDESIFEVIRILKEKNAARVGVFTSGVCFFHNVGVSPLTCQDASQLKNTGLDECYVSIYSHDSTVHDCITGFNGSHCFTVSSVKKLIEAGVDVKAHVTITKLNIHDLENTLYFIRELGIKESRILRIVKVGSALNNWRNVGVQREEQDSVVKRLLEFDVDGEYGISVSGYPEIMPCRPQRGAVGCEAASDLLYITLDGDVFPCACTQGKSEMKIGHISEMHKIVQYVMDARGNVRHKCLNSFNSQVL